VRSDAISRAIYEPLETIEALGAAIDSFGGGLALLRACRTSSGTIEDWLIVHVNEQVRSTWRSRKGELSDRRWTTLFGPLEDTPFCRLCIEALATGRRQEADIESSPGTQNEWRNVIVIPAGHDLVAVTTRDIAALRSAQEQLTLQRARMSALAEHISDIMIITDGDGRITWCSPAIRRVLGFDPSQWWARRLFEIVETEDASVACDFLPDALDLDRGRAAVHELRIASAKGEVRWFEATAHDERDNAALRGVVISLHDTTARRESALQLRASEARSRMIVDSVGDAIVTVDDRGLIQAFNAAAERTFGIEASEAVGTPWQRLVPEETINALSERNLTDMSAVDHVEMTARRANGDRFPAYLAMSSVETNGQRLWIGLCRDISDQKAMEAALERLALHDPLTGVPNRHVLLRSIEKALADAGSADELSSGSLLAVYYVDLDGFKVINDTLGHSVGDRALIETTIRIQRAARSGDTVARLGGDEFVVVCTGLPGVDHVDTLAERLRLEINQPVSMDGLEVALSASVGVAVWDGKQNADELLRAADTAMYEAKASRRRQVRPGSSPR
jgi:diguanylate cyclase (GGDEF)-like protein/PAS domain S-box-containing protein